MKKFATTLHTDGSGLWTYRVQPVNVLRMQVLVSDGEDFAEMRVFYDRKKWGCNELIYTDDKFKCELRDHLEALGFGVKACSDFDYSEAGMQEPEGDAYVSFDVGGDFIAAACRSKVDGIDVLQLDDD